MLSNEPLPLYEAYSYLLSVADGFSVRDFFDKVCLRQPEHREQYLKFSSKLSQIYNKLEKARKPNSQTAIERLFTPLTAGKNNASVPRLCTLFLDNMAAFEYRDYEEFKKNLYAFSAEVPLTIIESVTGSSVKGEYDPAQVFNAVTSLTLPQKNKNNIIVAALAPERFVDELIEQLFPIAEAFTECKSLWSEFIQIYMDDYAKFSSGMDLLQEKFDHCCDETSCCDIYPSVVSFYRCELFTCTPDENEEKQTTAIIGALYDTFQRQSKHNGGRENEVARIMSILGEPSRFKIILRLMQGPAYVGELAKCVELAPCTVSQHLSVLLGAKLVNSVDSGRRVYHSINTENMDAFAEAVYSMLKSK